VIDSLLELVLIDIPRSRLQSCRYSHLKSDTHTSITIMYSQTGLFGILFAVCVLGLLSRNQRKIKLSLPPGPTGLPIIGNAFDIPLVNMAQTYFGWTKEFGMEYTPQYLNSLKLACFSGSDIVYLEALGKKVIILNSYNVATELLDRRSHIYSSRGVSILLVFVANIYPRINRPVLTFLGELYAFHILIILHTTLRYHRMDLGWLFAMMPYGPEWKEHRQTFVHYFPMSNTDIHQPREIQLIRLRLLPQLVKSPKQFMEHIRQLDPMNSSFSPFMLTST